MEIDINSEKQMKEFGQKLGRAFKGGEALELIGDIGAGKTTLVKGIALGMGIDENVQSPSFTINANYQAKGGLGLSHYDFYRLQDAGIMTDALEETVGDKSVVTVVEWAGLVAGVLPSERLVINISTTGENSRHLKIESVGNLDALLKEITK